MNNNSNLTSDAKSVDTRKLIILEHIIKKRAQDIIGDIAELWYAKGYDIFDKAITTIITSDKKFQFNIDYAQKEITMTKYPKNSEYQDIIARKIQIALLFKPILEEVKSFVQNAPDYYGLSIKQIGKFKCPTVISIDSIQDRIAKNIKIDFLPAVINILTQDFPEIDTDFSMQLITENFDRHYSGHSPTH
jgi:hypothetical protein